MPWSPRSQHDEFGLGDGSVGERAGEGSVAFLVEGADEVEGGLDLVEDSLNARGHLALSAAVGVSRDADPLWARSTRERPTQAIDEAVGCVQGQAGAEGIGDHGRLPSLEESLLVLARYACVLPHHHSHSDPCG
jgi:hypothetical protein